MRAALRDGPIGRDVLVRALRECGDVFDTRRGASDALSSGGFSAASFPLLVRFPTMLGSRHARRKAASL